MLSQSVHAATQKRHRLDDLNNKHLFLSVLETAAAAAKSLQSCPTLCDPIDGSPPGSSVPGILQARIPEWVAISFSNAWKRKVKVKSLSCAWLLATPWTAAYRFPKSRYQKIQGLINQVCFLIYRWKSSLCVLNGGKGERAKYLGHLTWKANSLEKTLMLAKTEGKGEEGSRGWDG